MGGDLPEESSKLTFDDDELEAIPPLNQPQPEIKEGDIRLRHRIGRGPFGDVWIGTLHSHRDEFDEHHEVAVKVLPAIAAEHVPAFTSQLKQMFFKTQGAANVSWPLGFSIKDCKASIITKMFECSVHDKMSRLPDNRLPLEHVRRYCTALAQGLLDLHSHGLLALNLKPSNFLLDEHDRAVLGEFGVPFLLMDVVSKANPLSWLGTPNYMAPEQWDPKLRGPVSFQTDAWGFGCSMVEMLSGTKPWGTMSAGDIFHAVVEKREKPVFPSDLPPVILKMLKGCFEYDYRDRPTAAEILNALTSPNAMFKEGDWVAVSDEPRKQGLRIGVVKKVKGPESIGVLYCDKPEEPVGYVGLARCSSWTPFQVGDTVKLKSSVTTPTFSWGEYANSVATVVDADKNKALFVVKFQSTNDTFQADPAQLDLVYDGLRVGDWVRLREGWPSTAAASKSPSCVGVVHEITSSRDGVKVAFLGLATLWEGKASGNLMKVAPLKPGEFVKLRHEVVEPRFQWPMKKSQRWETGRIASVLPNGALSVDFPGRLWRRKLCFADADEVELVRLSDCNGLMGKYEHLQAMHWAIAPALYLLGFLAAARVGTALGGLVIDGKRKSRDQDKIGNSSNETEKSSLQITEYRSPPDKGLSAGNGGNPVWLPPAVASILFKEAV